MKTSTGQPSLLRRAEEQLCVFSDAAALLASSSEFDDTLANTISACLPALGDFGFFDVKVDGVVRRTARAHNDPATEAILRPTQWARQERSDLNLCALSTGLPALHVDIDDDWYRTVAVNDGHLALMRELGFRSMITVPMRYRDELIGALTLFMAKSGRQHTNCDLGFAAQLAMLASPTVANARLLKIQRSAEAALRLSEERLRLATDAGKLGIWDWDIPHDQVTWSDRIYEFHGLAQGEFSGRVKDFSELIHPDDRIHVQHRIDEAMRSADSYDAEFRAQHPDGSVRWLATRAALYRDQAGLPIRMVGATIDVTERVELLAAERAARAEAEAARRRMELLAAASSVFSQSLASDDTLGAIANLLVPRVADWCRVDLVDAAGELQHVLTYHADPAVRERGVALSHAWRAPSSIPGSIAWVVASNSPSLTTGITASDLEKLGNADVAGAIRRLGICASLSLPLVTRGRTLGALTLLQAESGRSFTNDDVSLFTELAQRAALALDNARLFAEAERARREAELANRAKDEFLAMLGHELRNPLAPIVTALKLMELRRGQSTEYEQGVIGRQVVHLSRLVDDLLDISRITQGKIELKMERLDIAAVVGKAVELVRPMLEKSMLLFDYQLPAEPVYVFADGVRLTQVISNLLNNAAKFTPAQGHIELIVTADEQNVHIKVRDSGIGISSDMLPHVFDLFMQGPQHIARQSGGLGLGLTIAKTFIAMHGGHIHAESQGKGRGSTFHIRLQRLTDAALPAATLPTSALQQGGGRILIVDDNADAGETLMRLLQAGGFEVRYAMDGPSALRTIEDFIPDLAILDIGLPAMDGYQLAHRLRDHPKLSSLRLVALTGYGRKYDRARANAAGFDKHLTKPVSSDVLIEICINLIKHFPARQATLK